MPKVPENIGSKYRFIIIAAERAKQLQNKAKPKVKLRSTKAAHVAMKEVESELISFEIPPQAPPQEGQERP
jgi:DNA-directed RNA polymerase omega subunit